MGLCTHESCFPPHAWMEGSPTIVRIAQGDLYLALLAVEPVRLAAPVGAHKSGRPGAGRVAEAAEDERPQGSSRELICGSLAAQSGAEA